MKAQYSRLMDVLHRACMIICGLCLVLITLIIPWGVFTRYVLNSASSWPEPLAVLAMIWFSFLAASLCYRERLHIGVAVIPMMLKGKPRIVIGWLIEICMMGVNVFMLWFGIKLVRTTWYQWISDFPDLISVGMSYLPVPIGGAITALFVIERIWSSEFFVEPTVEEISHVSTE
jgi:TRAP-type C4-dicarboxylate transport system permease small subunit